MSLERTYSNMREQCHNLYQYLIDKTLEKPEKSEKIVLFIKGIFDFYEKRLKSNSDHLMYDKIENAIELLRDANFIWEQLISLWKFCGDTEKLKQYEKDNKSNENDHNC